MVYKRQESPNVNFMRDYLMSLLALLCFRVIRPYCVDRTIGKYIRMTDYGFHESYEYNPQIIFDCKFVGLKFGHVFLSYACSYLCKFLERGYWRNLKLWHQKVIGVAEPLLGCLDMLLMPRNTYGYNDLKNFTISERAAKPEGRIVVYSVLTGKYDHIKDPLYISPNVDYVLFTNVDVKTRVWSVVRVENEGLSDLLLSRRIKMLPNLYLDEQYDISIYVDANVFIFGDITMLATKLNNKCDFAVSAHSVRNSVAAEIQELVAIRKVNYDLAQAVLSRYINEGFNDDLGLAECTVLVRKHKSEHLIKLMQEWWHEFESNKVYRDQISLMYCIWKTGFDKYELMDGHVMNNQYCTTRSHLRNVL